MKRRAIVCAPRLPEYDRECGSRRILDLVDFLIEDGWDVSYVALSDGEARYVRMLQRRGVATWTGLSAEVEEAISAMQFDLALLAFWSVAEQFIPIVRRLSPTTRILVDSIDLHFLRNARSICVGGETASASGLLNTDYAVELMRELNTYVAADGVLTVSRKETEIIGDFVSDPHLAMLVPLAEDVEPSPVSFEARQGVLFIGNFWHRPNVEAAEYLCRQVLPLVDPAILRSHPLYIVGHAMDANVRRLGEGLEGVQMVGWVPTLTPYLHRARISVIPLLHGAGTKGKMLQALMSRTPTVTTSIGAEGLDLRSGEHVLIADDAESFARSIERLLVDAVLWAHLAGKGQAHIAAVHGRDAVKTCFAAAVKRVMERAPKSANLAAGLARQTQSVTRLRDMHAGRVQAFISETVPEGSIVAVVSKGDPALVQLDHRIGWHFPQGADGGYAGHHPADDNAAIAAVETLRVRGAEYLLFPKAAEWWFEHYAGLHRYLASRYPLADGDPECGLIFDLRGQSIPRLQHLADSELAARRLPEVPAAALEAFRPLSVAPPPRAVGRRRRRVLVVGIYLGEVRTNVADVVATLADSQLCDVTQRWIGIGRPPTAAVAAVTVRRIAEKVPKFTLLNELLAEENLDRYDYVLFADDDVVFPRRFLDVFIPLQQRLGFALAQPARTAHSYTDHPIVEQQLGALARRTLFVEIGPVFCCARAAFPFVLPFDPISPMGWGYENVWSFRLAQHGMAMGIIDATPVDHSLRPVLANYAWDEAAQARLAFLERHEHLPTDACFHVLEVVALEG